MVYLGKGAAGAFYDSVPLTKLTALLDGLGDFCGTRFKSGKMADVEELRQSSKPPVSKHCLLSVWQFIIEGPCCPLAIYAEIKTTKYSLV